MESFKIYSGTLFYERDRDLARFNRELYLHGELKTKLRRINISSTEEEIYQKLRIVTNKIDDYIRATSMETLKFDITILKDKRAVIEKLQELTNQKRSLPAFCFEDMLYISAKNADLEIVAHEIGHMSVEKALGEIYLPIEVKEVISQFISKMLN